MDAQIVLVLGILAGGAVAFFAVRGRRAARRLAEEKGKADALLGRIQADLDRAARIQRDLLPKKNPGLEGCDIAGVNVPCYEIGGDYYDFVPLDDNRLALVIADVSGKGIAAALLMASLRATLIAEIRPGRPLDRLVAGLSDFVHAGSGPTSFVTFFIGELDRGSGELRYVNAGHNPPFIVEPAGAVRVLETSGFPLGMFAGAAYETKAVPFRPGELAVLYTDGIPEGRNSAGEPYSEKRLIDLIRENKDLSAEGICYRVLAETRGFVCGTQPCDDMTLVIVKRLTPGSTG